MVGIAIGLLTVAAAVGALMVSRSISGTVSDSSQLQQQAAYAFRVIGQQLRQAGGLNIDPTTGPKDIVAFLSLPASTPLPIAGMDSPASNEYKFTTTYQNVQEPTYSGGSTPTNGYLMRDCLGESHDIASDPLITSRFTLDANGNLVCAGNGNAQPLIGGVKDFRVTYLQQTLDAATLQPQFRYASATALTSTDWPSVYAVEVCLELEGTEFIDTVGSTYTKCDGSSASRGNKLRMVFRNTFYIRNQAWPAAGT
jgi:type IV pilus assembly protein PilW